MAVLLFYHSLLLKIFSTDFMSVFSYNYIKYISFIHPPLICPFTFPSQQCIPALPFLRVYSLLKGV
jgi:hypothetical protein